jgi:TatD DNase family protein
MFDTHCHLNFDVFDDVLAQVISEAQKAGVSRICVPGTDLQSSKRAIEIASKYPSLYAAVGLHPTEDLDETSLDETVENIQKLAESSDFAVAIGEVGLDYYKYKSPERVQVLYFQKQAELAAKLGLSLIIHNRQSTEALIEILKECWTDALSGFTVFHCVEPHDELLEFAKENKVYMGIDGDITYDEKKQEFVRKIPLDLLVVETDSPFLTPLPARKSGVKYNEPKYLPSILEKLSQILDVSKEELAETTNNNALKLFNLM